MKYKIFCAFAISVSLYSVLFGQVEKRVYYADENLVPFQRSADFTHLKLDISFVPEEGKVSGVVVHNFTSLTSDADTLLLHGIDLVIEEARLDGGEIKYRECEEGIVFDFGKKMDAGSQHRLEIRYHAFPKKGIYFIGWNDSTNRSRKQIWTQGQGTDNRHWIPMYDLSNDKMTTEMIVHMDEEFQVLSNGELVSRKRDKSGLATWHYRMKKPHATYLIMLGIGNYEIKSSRSPSGVPMNFYYYPDWPDRVNATYRYSEDMMRFMEEETGVPYPWPSYSQIPVQDFLYGAMENTTATVFGDFYCTDDRTFGDRNYVRVNTHELAHQWFGDLVTARTSSHTWLQESFATHYDLVYQGIAFGRDFFDWTRRQATIQSIHASENDLKPIAHSSAGTTRHYPKGSYVLQMLRDVAGNENFRTAIRYYLNKHAYGNVDTEDLLIAFHESTGLSLDWFWEEWIYRGGEPSYRVVFEDIELDGKRKARFRVEQIQNVNELTGLFKMPIELKVVLKNGTSVGGRVWVENRDHVFDFDLNAEAGISYALFDVGSRVMKKVEFEKDYGMLVSQAMGAEFMLDRYDAVKALESIGLERKREDLKKIYNRETFFAVRYEILRQLISDPQSADILVAALKDDDVEVRRGALEMTSGIHPALENEYEKLLLDSSYSIIAMALEKLCRQFPQRIEHYLKETDTITGSLEKNVRIKWLELSYHHGKDMKHIGELKDYLSPSYEFRTRVSAAQTLKSLNFLDEESTLSMFDALFSFNPRLRSPVLDVLNYFAQQLEYRDLIQAVIREGKWSTTEKKRLVHIKLG